MKNLATTLLMATLFIFGNAQEVKDQFTILKELGEGITIQGYYDLRQDDNGNMKASKGSPYVLNFVQNQVGKLYGFFGEYDYNPNQTPMVISSEWFTPNHHTKPSFFYDESALNPGIPTRSTNYFLFVGDVLYKISGEYKEIKAGGDYSLSRYIYYIDNGSAEAKSDEGGEEKKGKFGAKFKEKLSGLATEGGKTPTAIAKTKEEHRALIDNYLKEMEKVIAGTTLSSAEKSEVQQIMNTKFEKAGKAKDANAEWHKWMAENNGGDDSKNKVTIKNVGGKTVKITSCGTGYDISPGSSKSFSCSCKVTYAVLQGNSWKESTNIISKDANCGGIVNIQ